jgi:hypothetical protein
MTLRIVVLARRGVVTMLDLVVVEGLATIQGFIVDGRHQRGVIC